MKLKNYINHEMERLIELQEINNLSDYGYARLEAFKDIKAEMERNKDLKQLANEVERIQAEKKNV